LPLQKNPPIIPLFQRGKNERGGFKKSKDKALPYKEIEIVSFIKISF
jgi:hypothetical protein